MRINSDSSLGAKSKDALRTLIRISCLFNSAILHALLFEFLKLSGLYL